MKLADLMNKMNYNLKSKLQAGKSMLGSIETDLCKFFAGMNVTPEMIREFNANMVTNPEVFSNPAMYPNLNDVRLASEAAKQILAERQKVEVQQVVEPTVVEQQISGGKSM